MDRQYFKTNISPRHTYHGTVGHVLNIIADTVGTTFGPFGSHNLMQNGPETYASKDGLENLSMIKMDSSISSTVYQMALEVASNQANKVGDGTTSAVLILASVYKHLMSNEYIWNNYTPSEIHRAMGHIQNQIVNTLEASANKFESDDAVRNLIHTTVDANDDLTDLLMDLYTSVENLEDKNILIDYSSSEKGYYKTIQGMEVMGKLMNEAFGNRDIDTCVLRDSEVVIVDGKVNIDNDIINYVNKLKSLDKSLVIICSGVNDNFYRYIELLAQRQPELLTNFCVVYSTANSIQDKDNFYDLLKVTNCPYLEEGFTISSKTIEEISKGEAKNVVVKDRKLTLGGFTETPELQAYVDEIKAKMDELQEQLDSGTIPSEEVTTAQVQISRLRARYYKLRDGVTTIYVGGETTQRKSINYRLIEDGLKALQSAIEYGYFYGCNTMVPNILFHMIIEQEKADKRDLGGKHSLYYLLEECLLKAYLDVYKKLILNRVVLPDEDIMMIILGDAFEEMYDPETGYVKLKEYPERPILFRPVNLREGRDQDIINPAKTDINIVQKSLDAALVLATSNTIITNEVEFEGEVWR